MCSVAFPEIPSCKGTHRIRCKARQYKPTYLLFQAASDGCAACVRDLLEGKTPLGYVDSMSQSDSNRYTVKDFAEFASQKGVHGAEEVCSYLSSRWPQVVSAASTSTSSTHKIKCNGLHPVRSKARRYAPKYMLYKAASHGCLACVRALLEGETPLGFVDPLSKSDVNNYTVKDFAEHALRIQIAGADEVCAYLANRWPQL